MSGKFALIIGNTEYVDPGLAQLTAPGKDVEDFASVLRDKEIGAFDDVKVIVNEPSASVIESIDEFFDQKKPDDLLVLYFSGHGIRDEIGSLYLAFKNTIRTRLRATAIKADYIRESMDQSRSKRQVLILDCCNSGAFPPGTKAELGGAMGMTRAFQGYGRFVLTASDATQFAWEGDQVIGTQTDNSLFTHFLIKGLESEADNNGDGQITVDELYDYAFHQISQITPNQTPTKSASKQAGEIVLRENMRIEDIKPVALPDDLINEIEDIRPSVRESAVRWLEKIVKGKNIGMARSAIDALEKVATDENTTRRVSEMAMRVLESVREAEKKAEEERKAREEAERRAALEAEEKRLAFEKADREAKAEAARKAKEEAEKLARAKAEREAAEQEAARLKAEREAAERAARDATEKAVKEKGEREVAEWEAAQKAEREATELAARKKVEREATEKAEREAVELAARRREEREAKEKVADKESKVTRPSWMKIGIVGGLIITFCLCGYGVTRVLPALFIIVTPTEEAVVTEPPATNAANTPTEAPTLIPTPLGGGNGQIAFTSNRDDPNHDACGSNCNNEIYVMNAEGLEQTRLTNNAASDFSPTWSPDGKLIAFVSKRNESNPDTCDFLQCNFEIYVMNADGSEQTRLTNNAAGDFRPTWSPDSKLIAFESYREDNFEIYVMNADGSEQTRLTNNAAYDAGPTWSPDGKRIAFYSYGDDSFEIYVMNADGLEQTRLTNNAASDFAPTWSPDGNLISFESNRNESNPDTCGSNCNYEIYVMNADGSNETRLTNNAASDFAPTWSPDGKHIAFSSNRDGNSEIYVMNADGSNETRLTNNNVDDYEPAWRPMVQ